MLLITVLVTVLGMALAVANTELDKLYNTLPSKEFVDYFNNQNYSFKISDYDDQHNTRGSCILLPLVNASSLPIKSRDEYQLVDLPESFDSREQWPGCPTISEIYDQGYCGSCWTFGTATVASDRTCIHAGVIVRLSEEDLQCLQEDVCYGGYPSNAFGFWKEKGLVTRECRPYDIYNLLFGTCIKECNNGKNYEADKHFGEIVYSVENNTDAIKAELVSNGPVEAGMEVYEDFRQYKSGIYEYTFGKWQGRHSVRIIGYGNEEGVDYWLVANSYGSNWGMNGLIKIKIAAPKLELEESVYTGLPRK